MPRNLLQPSLPDDAYLWVFKPMLGCATDYFVISKRKGRSEMHFWMEFVKKTLRYYAVTCTFAMCMAHDVRHLRPVHNEATIFLGFARTGSQFTRRFFFRQIPASFARTPEVDFSRQITTSHAVLLFLETILILDLFLKDQNDVFKNVVIPLWLF